MKLVVAPRMVDVPIFVLYLCRVDRYQDLICSLYDLVHGDHGAVAGTDKSAIDRGIEFVVVRSQKGDLKEGL